MNKETATDVLSLLLQTGFSGRAEVGLIGDDDLLFKVSPDGSTWHEALRIDKDNGELTLPKRASTLATSGGLLFHDPSADPNFALNGFKFGHYYNTCAFPGGGAGGENYANAVWGFGINYADASATRLDSGKPSLGISIESKFYQGGTYGTEFHIQGRDTSNVNHRPLTGFFSHDGTTEATWNFSAKKLNFLDWSSSQKILLDTSANYMELLSSLVLRHGTNNTQWIQQRNSSGAFVTILYLDGTNRIRLPGAVYMVGAVDSATCAFLNVQPTSGFASGNIGLYMPLPTVTGQGYAIFAQGSFSTGQDVLLANATLPTARPIRGFWCAPAAPMPATPTSTSSSTVSPTGLPASTIPTATPL
jgi:hypothetical protein